MTNNDVFMLAKSGLLEAYGRTDADRALIDSTCERLFLMGREQGKYDAYEDMRMDMRLPEEEVAHER